MIIDYVNLIINLLSETAQSKQFFFIIIINFALIMYFN